MTPTMVASRWRSVGGPPTSCRRCSCGAANTQGLQIDTASIIRGYLLLCCER
jgi:hypothetical protein